MCLGRRVWDELRCRVSMSGRNLLNDVCPSLSISCPLVLSRSPSRSLSPSLSFSFFLSPSTPPPSLSRPNLHLDLACRNLPRWCLQGQRLHTLELVGRLHTKARVLLLHHLEHGELGSSQEKVAEDSRVPDGDLDLELLVPNERLKLFLKDIKRDLCPIKVGSARALLQRFSLLLFRLLVLWSVKYNGVEEKGEGEGGGGM